MFTLALIAQKGGTGKTTLAVNLAASFEAAGGSAAVVDLDPQASAALWGDRRGRSPFVGAIPATRLEAALGAARRSGADLAAIDTSPRTDPPALAPLPVSLAAACCAPATLAARLWNEFVERYHYLGYKPLPGAQLRYFVHAADGLLLALLGFGAAAWKPPPATVSSAGSPPPASATCPWVVNHARYLILPWIRLPSLASHLLACLQRQLPDDWRQRYGIRPVLLETFCETPRFAGTCYRAANWIHLGQTQGRGKLDTRHEYNEPVKNVFVKPLCPDWKEIPQSLAPQPSIPSGSNAYGAGSLILPVHASERAPRDVEVAVWGSATATA